MQPLLDVSDVSKTFLGTRALREVSFTLAAGEVLALIGENGAGKSTLIRMLSGAHQPDDGRISLEGREISIADPGDAERHGIATVYQELNLFPDLSVAENLMFSSFVTGTFVRWRQAKAEARRFLAEFGLDVDVDARVRTLSVAEKQMLEIAKALHRDARVLILDEPTAVLGGADVERLLRLVRSLASRGVAVIFVSHRLDEVFDVADRYLVLKDGAKSGEGRIADIDHEALVSMMVGREFSYSSQRERTVTNEVVLEVEGIRRAGVLGEISFSLHRGEVLGIAGLRGAGRTELARAVFGADRRDGGTVKLDGVMVPGTPSAAIKAGLGLVPEERKSQGLFTALSTVMNIPMARFVTEGQVFARPLRDRRTATEYRDRLRIKADDLDAPVATLSGGNQQKVVLAKWLESDVRVLILDEPTRGIDIGAKQEIYQLIEKLCRSGLGVVIISSELPEVVALSDRVLVMHHGDVAAELTGNEITEEEIMRYAVGGTR